MALREVLAELDARVRGASDVRAVMAAVDRFSTSAYAAATPLEQLRLKQIQATATAQRLARELRELTEAGGENAAEINQLQIAQVRATEAARQYGAQIAQLERQEREQSRARVAELEQQRRAQERLAEQQRDAEQRARQSRGLTGFLANLRAAGPQIAAAAAGLFAVVRGVQAVSSEIEEIVQLGDDLDKTSQRIGTSTRALQEWRFVGAHAGLTAEQMDHALETFNRTTGQAAQGTGEAVQSYRRLHIALRDGNGQLRDSDAVFRDVRMALARIENPMERAAIASRIFGESAAQLNPILNMTEEELAGARARFVELGGGLSEDLVGNARDAEDAMGDFRLAMTSLRGVLVANFLPALTRGVTALATWVGRGVELVRTSSTMQTVMGGLAVAAAAVALALAPVTLTTLALIAPFAALFLVVEDVVSAFRGGDSVIGGLVERMFEAMGLSITFAGVIDHLGLAWDMMAAKARDALADVVEAAQGVQLALGIGDQDAAEARTQAARQAAQKAHARVATTQSLIDAREQQRVAERQARAAAIAPAPPTVEAADARRGRGRAAGASVSQTFQSTFHITAQDPTAVGREIERVQRRQLREAADTLPLAAPEPA